MPFCPKCRYEYVPGIVECPDCNIKLVEKLHEEKPEPIPEQDFELITVGTFSNYIEAEMAQLKLQSEGIESVLANDIVSRTSRIPTFSIASPFAVEVKVREEDAARAAMIIEEVLRGDGDER